MRKMINIETSVIDQRNGENKYLALSDNFKKGITEDILYILCSCKNNRKRHTGSYNYVLNKVMYENDREYINVETDKVTYEPYFNPTTKEIEIMFTIEDK